jgi:hypothetical protein
VPNYNHNFASLIPSTEFAGSEHLARSTTCEFDERFFVGGCIAPTYEKPLFEGCRALPDTLQTAVIELLRKQVFFPTSWDVLGALHPTHPIGDLLYNRADLIAAC